VPQSLKGSVPGCLYYLAPEAIERGEATRLETRAQHRGFRSERIDVNGGFQSPWSPRPTWTAHQVTVNLNPGRISDLVFMKDHPQFLVFPVDPDEAPETSLTSDLPLNGPAMEAVLTHTFKNTARDIPTPSVYELSTLSEASRLPECICGCGQRVRGKQRYATTACQVRVWRAEHPKAPEAHSPDPKVSICQSCLGWKLGDGEAFICESCADKDVEKSRTGYAPLLRLSPRPNDPIRSVMIYIGTCNVMSWRLPDGEWTEIAAPGNPLVDKLIEALGGHNNLVPTAQLVAEAEKQLAARAGTRALTQVNAVNVHSEEDAEMHAAVLRDREVWGQQLPINPKLRARRSTDSKEHDERTKAKYPALVHEQPDLFG
jgi:hypothetical protein